MVIHEQSDAWDFASIIDSARSSPGWILCACPRAWSLHQSRSCHRSICGHARFAAMATQNALVKLDLPGFPSTAVLTTNTVQLTIDLAMLVRGNGRPEEIVELGAALG